MPTSRVARDIPVASRVNRFSYAIRNIVVAAKAVEARGRQVRYLNIGDPIPFGFKTPPHMVEAVARAVREIRARPIAKPPGIAEAVEWANAATVLEKGGGEWPEAFRRAIGVLIKDEEDLSCIVPDLDRIVAEALE